MSAPELRARDLLKRRWGGRDTKSLFEMMTQEKVS